MRTLSPVLVNAFSLSVLLVGTVVSFFSLEAGFPLILASIGVACISRYRAKSWFSGSLAVIPAVLIFVYVAGAVDRESPVFNTNVSPTVWAIIGLGSVSLILGIWLAAGTPQPVPTLENFDSRGSEFLFWLGVAAAAASLINYATGGLPLLSGDIDGNRFGVTSGALARFWVLVHPITQVSVIAFLVKLLQRSLDARWAALGMYSIASLIFTGGRSLAAVALLAFGILYLEIKRPKLQLVLFTVVVGIALIGTLGLARSMASANADAALSYLSRRGLYSWSGSLDLSLQTGPRVLTVAINNLADEHLGGRILLGDLPGLAWPYRSFGYLPYGSGYLVTAITGRDTNLGGSPPTIFGGLYLDFGWFGVAIGALLVGFLLVFCRKLMYRTPNFSSYVWFGYFASYITLSGYSYLSFKPQWIIVLLVCAAARVSWGKANGSASGRPKVSPAPMPEGLRPTPLNAARRSGGLKG
jgi:hypothetical protein